MAFRTIPFAVALMFLLTINVPADDEPVDSPVGIAVDDIAVDEPVVKKSTSPEVYSVSILLAETSIKDVNRTVLELNGTPAEIGRRVTELEQEGKLDVIQRVRLTTIEGVASQIQIGETIAVRSGQTRSFSRGGSSGFGPSGRSTPSSPSVQYTYQHQDVGTLVSAEVGRDDQGLTLEIAIQKSRIVPNTTAGNGVDSELPKTVTATIKSTVRIISGQPILIGGMTSDTTSGANQVLALLQVETITPKKSTDD